MCMEKKRKSDKAFQAAYAKRIALLAELLIDQNTLTVRDPAQRESLENLIMLIEKWSEKNTVFAAEETRDCRHSMADYLKEVCARSEGIVRKATIQKMNTSSVITRKLRWPHSGRLKRQTTRRPCDMSTNNKPAINSPIKPYSVAYSGTARQSMLNVPPNQSPERMWASQ